MVRFLVAVWGWAPIGDILAFSAREMFPVWVSYPVTEGSGNFLEACPRVIAFEGFLCPVSSMIPHGWAGVGRMINTYQFSAAFSWRAHGTEGQWCLIILPDSPHIQDFSDTCLQRVSSSSRVHWQHREPGSAKLSIITSSLRVWVTVRCFHSSPEKHMIASSNTIRLRHGLSLLLRYSLLMWAEPWDSYREAEILSFHH